MSSRLLVHTGKAQGPEVIVLSGAQSIPGAPPSTKKMPTSSPRSREEDKPVRILSTSIKWLFQIRDPENPIS